MSSQLQTAQLRFTSLELCPSSSSTSTSLSSTITAQIHPRHVIPPEKTTATTFISFPVQNTIKLLASIELLLFLPHCRSFCVHAIFVGPFRQHRATSLRTDEPARCATATNALPPVRMATQVRALHRKLHPSSTPSSRRRRSCSFSHHAAADTPSITTLAEGAPSSSPSRRQGEAGVETAILTLELSPLPPRAQARYPHGHDYSELQLQAVHRHLPRRPPPPSSPPDATTPGPRGHPRRARSPLPRTLTSHRGVAHSPASFRRLRLCLARSCPPAPRTATIELLPSAPLWLTVHLPRCDPQPVDRRISVNTSHITRHWTSVSTSPSRSKSLRPTHTTPPSSSSSPHA